MADNTQSDFRQHGRRGRLIKPETFRGSPSSALDWLDKGLANKSSAPLITVVLRIKKCVTPISMECARAASHVRIVFTNIIDLAKREPSSESCYARIIEKHGARE